MGNQPAYRNPAVSGQTGCVAKRTAGIVPNQARTQTALLDPRGTIRILAHLIECKIAKSTVHLEKARSQLENGLRHLMQRFKPRREHQDDPFDQRFWRAQLQRLIANKSLIPGKNQREATAALEKLGDGDFEIIWNAMTVTFWTDSDRDCFTRETEWHFREQGQDIPIAVFSCGTELVRNVCCKREKIFIPAETEPLSDSPAETEPLSDRTEPDASNSTEIFPDVPATDEIQPVSDGENATVQDNDDAPADNKSAAMPVQVPDRIFLGHTETAKREICWEFGHPELPNRHLLIFGKSGVGKTYAIQSILYELGFQGQHAVIIDYTSGFLPNHLETEFSSRVSPKTHLVLKDPLPINPFRRQQRVIEGFDPIVEDPHTVGGRITSVFTSVYSSIGEQQRAALTKTIAEGLNQYGSAFDFKKLLEQLEEQGTSAVSLANKLAPLVHANLFSAEDLNSWHMLCHESEYLVNIMQLAGVPRDISQMATEFILWDIYDFATNNGKKDVPLPVVLDEIQNLDHRLDAPLAKILTEGRKFGLSLILATQTLSNLKAEERDRLFQASHKLFFKPADTEVHEYAKILERSANEKSDVWISRLTSLNKGECYSLGPSLNPQTGKIEDKAFRIRMTSFEERLQKRRSVTSQR